MKIYALIIYILLSISNLFANEPNSAYVEDNDSIYLVVDVDEPPEFPGGVDSLFKFMRSTFVYPDISESLEGNPLIQFVVNKDGTVSDAKILRDIHPLIDKEALRVVNSMPRWKPGRHQGRIVRVQYYMPFRLKIESL